MYVLAEEDFPSRFEDKILSAGKALWEAHRISGGKKSLMRLRWILSEVYEPNSNQAYVESENLVSCLRTSS